MINVHDFNKYDVPFFFLKGKIEKVKGSLQERKLWG